MMGRLSRNESCPDDEVNVVHCINRCVRRGFLCGKDPVTGNDYEHRREWIRHRLEFLAGVMGVEILGYAILSNHFHVVFRNRPDLVGDWSDDEVALRWWQLCPGRRDDDGVAMEPTELELKANTGFLSMTLAEYLQLLDWTGRQIRRDGKLGATPTGLKPLLERMGVSAELWVDCVKRFGKWHASGVGRPASLKRHAERTGCNRSLNASLSRQVFA